MRSLSVPIMLCLACGGDDGSPASGSQTSVTTVPTDSGESGSATSTGTGTGTDEVTAEDSSSSESSGANASSSTSAETTSGASTGSDSDDQEGGGTIDVTLDGCAVDFGGTIVVSYNGSLGVASVYDNATLTGSFQFELDGTGTMPLSSQHRVDTGNVVNMVDIAQGTWTNLDSDALTGGIDRISGTLAVDTWNPSEGQASITFTDVNLLNVVDGNVCTIDGTVSATQLYP